MRVGDRFACSTPFGINGSVTVSAGPLVEQLCVLNASASRIGHSAISSALVLIVWCSTPFASTDRSPLPLPPATVLGARAQRLSASTDRSLAASGTLAAGRGQCSTPFGINGSVTRGSLGSFRPRLVLNAFGINGSVTRTTTPGRTPLSGAQRLSASTDRSPPPFSCVSPGLGSAQRLSASTDRSQPICLSRSHPSICAQRLSASTDRSRRSLRRCVDGSTCAQRLSASTDRSQLQVGVSHLESFVLNAFRHQRIGHPTFHEVDTMARKCSTPFGINGSVTL